MTFIEIGKVGTTNRTVSFRFTVLFVLLIV